MALKVYQFFFLLCKYYQLNMAMAQAILKRITIDPDICHGKPTIRGFRYPVDNMLELMASRDESNFYRY
jgi:uncharacterized protein (DUF433 family)